MFPLAALLATPQVMAAAVAVVTLLGAGISGAFDYQEVEVNDDREQDGIFIPINPTIQDSEIVEDDYEYSEVYPTPTPNKFSSVLPMGYVSINSSAQISNNEFDPDIPDDIRPPSSSFGIAGEAYDSGFGFLLMLIIGGILAAYVVTLFTSQKVRR